MLSRRQEQILEVIPDSFIYRGESRPCRDAGSAVCLRVALPAVLDRKWESGVFKILILRNVRRYREWVIEGLDRLGGAQ